MKWARKPPEPEPAPAPIIRTHIEHDLRDLHITPAPIEPSAWHRQVAHNHASMYAAYLQVGFNRKQAYDLTYLQIEHILGGHHHNQ